MKRVPLYNAGSIPLILVATLCYLNATTACSAQSLSSFADEPSTQPSAAVDDGGDIRESFAPAASDRRRRPRRSQAIHETVEQVSTRSIRHSFPPLVLRMLERMDKLSLNTPHEQKLSEFVDHVRSQGLSVHVDERALEDEGVNVDNVVRSPQLATPLGHQLDLSLRPLGLCWTIDDHGRAIVITSMETADEDLCTVTYDVTTVTPPGSFGDMLQVITSTVRPDSWDDVGGPATVQPIEIRGRRLLVIAHNIRTQLRVLTLLNTLHRMGGSAWSEPSLASHDPQSWQSPGSSAIAVPSKAKKRGIRLPSEDSSSTSSFGGMGGMGGMAGGMF